ncbi:ArsR/SmtB family transcription factor [Ereboglobus luteus]|uniref:Transcriptional regulator n=1 Tax=Ereboglobus luteus TaxID=1796921 RepID=A0A2U8E2M5_9BACT|nr:metalloregulator ArsR/SmtB family transcription factor [Ereboglobus luteus]AWI08782.1 transcriptional regulator [Ereboglobus luteus]
MLLTKSARSKRARSPSFEHEAAVFKALGHPARLQIVARLAGGEQCVCDLVDLTGLGWSTVSRHLSVLRDTGVIEAEKRGMQVFYRLRLPCVARFISCLQSASDGQDVRFTVKAGVGAKTACCAS